MFGLFKKKKTQKTGWKYLTDEVVTSDQLLPDLKVVEDIVRYRKAKAKELVLFTIECRKHLTEEQLDGLRTNTVFLAGFKVKLQNRAFGSYTGDWTEVLEVYPLNCQDTFNLTDLNRHGWFTYTGGTTSINCPPKGIQKRVLRELKSQNNA